MIKQCYSPEHLSIEFVGRERQVLGTWLRCNSIIFVCSDEVQNYTRISVVCSLSSNPVSELSGAYWFVR